MPPVSTLQAGDKQPSEARRIHAERKSNGRQVQAGVVGGGERGRTPEGQGEVQHLANQVAAAVQICLLPWFLGLEMPLFTTVNHSHYTLNQRAVQIETMRRISQSRESHKDSHNAVEIVMEPV